MSDMKFYDYLVFGGEHDGKVFNGPHVRILEVSCEKQPLARFYSRDAPAEVTVPKVVQYQVREHITANGVPFFIASNDDLTNVDVDAKIVESGMSPKA
ncbi:hypothetical protein MXM81_00050 [Serratia plymuthica]|uniref:hypothetical protein n=1 Tax=Serratia plymuthica TaxID=82996 RepID=UPI002DB7B010|nr:hypothetical protein [Serratia plymuthica]MEB6537479.1 hypothetical protein [Serratia plymuthica]